MVEQRRGASKSAVGGTAVGPKPLRTSPKLAQSLSVLRRATLQDEIERGLVQEAEQFSGSLLRRGIPEPPPTDVNNGLNRGAWLPGHNAYAPGNKRLESQGVIAHSPSFRKQASISSSGLGSSAGAPVERLAPEVYSPLFTMANLNLPRDRITVNAWCFLPGTMVWMADGTRKPIEEVQIGDTVLSGEGIPRHVTTVFKRHVDEEIVGIRVKGTQETVWCTGNHQFNAIKAEVVKCRNCEKNKYRNCRPINGKCPRCGQDNPYEFSKIAAIDLEKHDCLYMPMPKENKETPILSKDGMAELLGYYVAEGCSGHNELDFVFGAHEREAADKVISLMKNLFGYCPKESHPPSAIRLRCYSKELMEFFSKHAGHRALVKRLSTDVISMPASWLRRFLFAWADGDGCQGQGRRFDGRTSSPYLAWQLRFVALKCGLIAHIWKGKPSTMICPITGKRYNAQPSYLVRMAGKSATEFFVNFGEERYRFNKDTERKRQMEGCSFIRNDKMIQYVDSVSKKHYRGFVHNIEVECDHSYNVGYGVHVGNCRNFFDLHPLVRNAITLHATYPISKLNIKCPDKKVEQEFEDMIEEMDLLGALGDISLEYWKLGEAFPFAELDENNLKWRRIVVQNPDYINVKKMVLASEPVISLRPDAVLQRLVMSNAPTDVQLRKQIPQHIIHHVRRGESIPLDNFNVSHLKMLSSPYDVRGTSIIVSAFKDLMLYDKLRECKFAQADDLVNPITLVKIGGAGEGEYHPDAAAIEEWRQIIEEAQYDKNFKIVTHAAVAIERVGSSSAVLDISQDNDLIIKNIMHGLMVPQAVIDTESAVYASASIGLEVLRQRYFNFRNMLAKWLMNKIFAPISDLRGYYKAEGGYKKLIVPEVEWNQMNLYDLQDYISNISGLVTAKQVSLDTLYRSLGLNYEDERQKMRKETVNDAIRQREEQALASMSLIELRSLDPEREILEPTLAAPPMGGVAPAGGAPGMEGGMGTPPPGGGGMPPMGGGGLPGGLPELAPPPGEALMGPGGAGAPLPGGVTPPLGPGTSGGPPGPLGK